MDEHTKLLSELFNYIEKEEIKKILDAGSERTSLNNLISNFPNASIDAIICYNDDRKKNSIYENVKSSNFSLYEKDITKDTMTGHHDLVLAHLLLGEATKWGNNLKELLNKLLEINSKYFIIVDYKEDPTIDYKYLEELLNSNFNIIKKLEITKNIPQKFNEFIGENYVGYIIKNLK